MHERWVRNERVPAGVVRWCHGRARTLFETRAHERFVFLTVAEKADGIFRDDSGIRHSGTDDRKKRHRPHRRVRGPSNALTTSFAIPWSGFLGFVVPFGLGVCVPYCWQVLLYPNLACSTVRTLRRPKSGRPSHLASLPPHAPPWNTAPGACGGTCPSSTETTAAAAAAAE
jgi:hypothetical protein